MIVPGACVCFSMPIATGGYQSTFGAASVVPASPGPVRTSPRLGLTAGPELREKRVVLVPVTAEHVPELRRILHTPEV